MLDVRQSTAMPRRNRPGPTRVETQLAVARAKASDDKAVIAHQQLQIKWEPVAQAWGDDHRVAGIDPAAMEGAQLDRTSLCRNR